MKRAESLIISTTSAVAFVAICSPAFAQELVVATFGGSWLDNTKECIGKPFEQKTKAHVTFVPSSSAQTAAKLRATRNHPEFDVAYMEVQFARQIKVENLMMPLDASQLTNLPDVIASVKDPDNDFVGVSLSALAIAYDPRVVKAPPASWADLWNPQFKGKIAIPDISQTGGQQLLIAAARLHGGSIENIDPGVEAIKQLKPNVVTFWTQPDQVVALFERGDIVITPWYVDRIGAAAAKGLSVAVAFPKEGAIGSFPTTSIPVGSSNVKLAHEFINTAISPDAQRCFAEKQFGGPVNQKVTLPPAVANAVPYGENRSKLFFPNFDEMSKQLPTWTERWGREIGR